MFIFYVLRLLKYSMLFYVLNCLFCMFLGWCKLLYCKFMFYNYNIYNIIVYIDKILNIIVYIDKIYKIIVLYL